MFVGYDSASNYIEGIPTKNRTQQELTRAVKQFLTTIKNAGRSPEYHILDNECSALMKECIQDMNIKIQKVPPSIHRRNIAERAIQT